MRGKNSGLFWLLLFAFGMEGCATLSKGQCLGGDWRKIGYNDAVQGYSSDRIGGHQKACEKYQVAPDRETYLSGYRQGLVRYCTPESGWQVGRQGHSYAGICPGDLEPAFLKNYQLGQESYRLHQDIERLERDIANDEREMGQQNCPEEKRRELRLRIRDRERRLRSLQFEINRVEWRRPY